MQKNLFQRIWHFIWEEDSILSWIVNIVLAFVLIKFIIYPGIGLILGTSYPVVAVVSGSMEHKVTLDSFGRYSICGTIYEEPVSLNFDGFWEVCGQFYQAYDIDKQDFSKFPFKNGFYTGDIIVLIGKKPEDIKIGDVIVFRANKRDPIIHRVIKKWYQDGGYHFQTKGDHNEASINELDLNEVDIGEDRVIGKAVLKIPFLGYIKIWFVKLLELLGLSNSLGRLFL